MKKNLIRYCDIISVKLISFILLLFIFSGCLSVKPSAIKSGKNYFETFYVGEEGTQYFIKPIFFTDEKLKEDLIVDITFRYKNEIKDSAIVNISIESPFIYKTIDSLKLSNKAITITSDKVVLLFNEKSRTGFTSRYATKFSLKEIKEMFTNDAWQVIIHNKNKIITYKPHRKTTKAIEAVKERVFVLM